MKHRLRALAAGVALTATAATGYALAGTVAPPRAANDTTWGAPDPQPADTGTGTGQDDGQARLLDTTWG